MVALYEQWITEYPVVNLEDGLEQADMRRAIPRGVYLDQANMRGMLLSMMLRDQVGQWIHDRLHRFDRSSA